MLNSPEGQETMRRISLVQNLQNQVSALKSKMTALREKIDGNHHLKATFSDRLANIEKHVIDREKDLDTLIFLFMNNRGKLNDMAKAKVAEATSPKIINTMAHELEASSRDFQELEQECSRRKANIERRAQQVQENPLSALQEAMLYLDRGDTTLSDEAYKAYPELVAENIIAVGTVLLGKEIYPNSPEAEALYNLIRNFSKGVLYEFSTAKGGKEFLGKLKQYCQKLAKPLEPKISQANTEIAKKQAEIRVINSRIEREQQTLGNRFLKLFEQKPDGLTRLEAQKSRLESDIMSIKKRIAIQISGDNGNGMPRTDFRRLQIKLETLQNAEKNIDRKLQT
jgi:predicted  nucleic acid-binding Zn-ribbon protein